MPCCLCIPPPYLPSSAPTTPPSLPTTTTHPSSLPSLLPPLPLGLWLLTWQVCVCGRGRGYVASSVCVWSSGILLIRPVCVARCGWTWLVPEQCGGGRPSIITTAFPPVPFPPSTFYLPTMHATIMPPGWGRCVWSLVGLWALSGGRTLLSREKTAERPSVCGQATWRRQHDWCGIVTGRKTWVCDDLTAGERPSDHFSVNVWQFWRYLSGSHK